MAAVRLERMTNYSTHQLPTSVWAVSILSFRAARPIGTRVKPGIGTFTVAMPCYERADFATLREPADDRAEMRSYSACDRIAGQA